VTLDTPGICAKEGAAKSIATNTAATDIVFFILGYFWTKVNNKYHALIIQGKYLCTLLSALKQIYLLG